VKRIRFLLIVPLFICACNSDLSRSEQERIVATGNSPGKSNSTTSAPVRAAEYISWVRNPENGLLRKKTIDELSFSAQYKPCSYIACLESAKADISDTILRRKLSELEGMEYIDLKIELEGGQGELLKHDLHSAKQYDERITYFSFGMQKDIFLVAGADTIPCGLYHFERAYDVTPYSVFLLGFATRPGSMKTDRTLVFHDNTFHKGIIKLNFSASDLSNIPKLKTI
jgi:hypothetical protein